MKQTDKKILFATRLYYPHIGGVEKHVNKITRELLLKKKQVTIVTELYDTQLKQKEQFQGHTVYRIPIGKNTFLKKFYIWLWFLKNISLIQKADIIHVHDVAYWLLPFKLIYPRKRFYVTFHGYEDYPVRKKWIVQRKIIEQVVNGSICIGEFMKKWYKANPSVVLYGGADMPKEKSKLKSGLSVLYFGRLEKQTNAYEYAQAVANLNKKITIHSAFVGEGPLAEKINKLVNVFPFDSNIESTIANYRFIFVSRYLSMLESLASKRLIFAYYDTPIKKDYLLQSPFKDFIIPVRSAKQLEERLLYFMKHPKEERRITENGFSWAKQNSWKNVTEQYLSLWEFNS